MVTVSILPVVIFATLYDDLNSTDTRDLQIGDPEGLINKPFSLYYQQGSPRISQAPGLTLGCRCGNLEPREPQPPMARAARVRKQGYPLRDIARRLSWKDDCVARCRIVAGLISRDVLV